MVNSNFRPYILYAPFPYVIITKSKHKYCFYDSPLSIHSLIQIIIIISFNDLIIIITFFSSFLRIRLSRAFELL